MTRELYTIGHSNHPPERFLELLKAHDIMVVVDVRSSPYSRFHEQFNREPLKETLAQAGLKYVFLGKELGARSEDASCYVNGKVSYDLLARTALFRQGLERVRRGVEQGYRIALMCAEKDPIECHRAILVARNLSAMGFDMQHILHDGSLESHDRLTERLIEKFNLKQFHLFESGAEEEGVIDKAYRLQGEKIAYEEASLQEKERRAAS